MPTSIFPRNSQNVLPQRDENAPVNEPVQVGCDGKQITKAMMEALAIEKYRANGDGITISDIKARFGLKKSRAQRSLKHFHSRNVLFTAKDLMREGIHFLKNKNPQEYFASCIKADILENLEKRKSVPVDATGVNLPKGSVYPLSNAIEHQKAHNFLEVLGALAYAIPRIHKLQLMFHLNTEFFNELKQSEDSTNRAKSHEENIGRRHITYRLSPNGTIEVYIATTNTPLRIERDEDISALFAFLGQVRDRLLYHVGDIKEKYVPNLLNWILKQCDLNKDVKINNMAQITFPDIQLKSADRVFRLYIKIINGKAYCRGEESLALSQALPEALDNIRHPYKSLEKKIDHVIQLLESESALRKKVQTMTTNNRTKPE